MTNRPSFKTCHYERPTLARDRGPGRAAFARVGWEESAVSVRMKQCSLDTSFLDSYA